MKDRSATATIKGYFYQFDQTIVRLLESSKNASVIVEGIEDIDLNDGEDSAFVQCKYYEGTEYNHSVIKDAVINMLKHFHSMGCPDSQTFKYRLYGHYRSGHSKLIHPFDDTFLKNNFLTYTRSKTEHKVHEELSITLSQLASFRTLLDIDLNAPSYEDQQKKVIQLLIAEIAGCTAEDAQIFYYPNAINVIQGLAVEADELRRKITKENFLKNINRKDIIFNLWIQQKFGAAYFAKLIRRKFFTSNATKMSKASRIFVFDMEGENQVSKTAEMLIKLGEFFSHREHVRTPSQDRFCPYVLLRGVTPAELIEIKSCLWRQGVQFNDGYPFHGADFSAALLAADPTKENLSLIKFIPSDDQLAPIVSAITGLVIEIYDFYKSSPLDDTLVPNGNSYQSIKIDSSYFIQEVIEA